MLFFTFLKDPCIYPLSLFINFLVCMTRSLSVSNILDKLSVCDVSSLNFLIPSVSLKLYTSVYVTLFFPSQQIFKAALIVLWSDSFTHFCFFFYDFAEDINLSFIYINVFCKFHMVTTNNDQVYHTFSTFSVVCLSQYTRRAT